MNPANKKRLKLMLWLSISSALCMTAAMLKALVPPDNVSPQTYHIIVVAVSIPVTYVLNLLIPFILGLIGGGVIYAVKKKEFWNSAMLVCFICWILVTVIFLGSSISEMVK